MDAAERHDAGDAPAGANDHLAADLLADEPVRRADVVLALRRDRRRLQAQAVLSDRSGGFVHDPILRRSPRLEREVVAREVDLEADHVGSEHAERFLEQLLSRLVPLQHDDRVDVHGRRMLRGIQTGGGWREKLDDGETRRMATSRVAAAIPL